MYTLRRSTQYSVLLENKVYIYQKLLFNLRFFYFYFTFSLSYSDKKTSEN